MTTCAEKMLYVLCAIMNLSASVSIIIMVMLSFLAQEPKFVKAIKIVLVHKSAYKVNAFHPFVTAGSILSVPFLTIRLNAIVLWDLLAILMLFVPPQLTPVTQAPAEKERSAKLTEDTLFVTVPKI